MEIDIVYAYVNPKDQEWAKKRAKYANDDFNQECRFRDNNEFKYSLRSIDKYAPWIRKIFIIMDSEVPEWLDTSNSRIKIIKHTEIMPKEALPCYNSEVIEMFIDNISDLSEIFLYANDDMFLGNYVSKNFFIKNNRPLIRMVKTEILPNGWYDRSILKAQSLIYKEYGVKFNLIPTHNIDVYSKDAIKKCKLLFKEDIEKMISHHLREDGDIERALFHYYMISNNACELKIYDDKDSKYFRFIRRAMLSSIYLDYIFYRTEVFFRSKQARVLFFRKPRLVCINDSELTTDKDLQKYQRLMNKKFPQKSQFEI